MTDLAKVTLAKNLVLARSAKGITQDALAEAAHLSRATIAQIESGDSDPHLSTIADLAAALEVSPILLLLGESELAALAKIAKETPDELLKDELTADDLDKMRRLVQSGMFKSQVRAAKIGVSAAHAAGFTTAGAAAGAAIGSVLFPGIGTAIGALLGGFLSGATAATVTGETVKKK